MKTVFKIFFAMTMLMCVAAAQVPLLNRVGTTIYPWRPGDKFSDSLLSANAALLNKNNVFTGAVNTFNAVTLSTALDTAYSNSVSNILVTAPLSVSTSGRAKFLSLSNLGSMYYVDSAKYHGSASINTVGALASGSIAPGFGSINIGSNTINSGAITSAGQISGTTLKASAENIYIGSVTNVYRIDNLGPAGYEWRFLNPGNSINGITANSISQSGTAVNYFLGNVGIGTTSPSSTARLSIKAGLTTNIQEWYRSSSSTATAIVDSNGSFFGTNVGVGSESSAWTSVSAYEAVSNTTGNPIVLRGHFSNTSALPMIQFDWGSGNGQGQAVQLIATRASSLNSGFKIASLVNSVQTDLLTFASGNATFSGIVFTNNIRPVTAPLMLSTQSEPVGIGFINLSFPSTAQFAVKGNNSPRINLLELHRSASSTAVASIDTNGSVTFNNTANTVNRFNWDATANGGAGGLLLSYLYVDRLAQKATDLQVGSVVAPGGTYFVAGLGGNLNNAFTFSSPSNGTGASISNTGYVNIKSTNQRPNIQEWYRSSSIVAVASIDTLGIGQFRSLKIGGSGFAKIDSAKVLGDTLKYYVNGVAYNAVKGSGFNLIEAILLFGVFFSFIAAAKKIIWIRQTVFILRVLTIGLIFMNFSYQMTFAQERPSSPKASTQIETRQSAFESKRDSTLSLSIEKFDARLQELQGELEKQAKTKEQAQKVLQQTEDNIKGLQSAIQAMMMVKKDTTLHVQSRKK